MLALDALNIKAGKQVESRISGDMGTHEFTWCAALLCPVQA